MNNDIKKYDANFTAGGILHHEFNALIDILMSDDFEVLIKEETEQNNLIGIATNSSRKRIISEIKRRKKHAPSEFWNNFLSWTEPEQKLALFYLCLKSYPLILDLHLEVALKKYRTGSSMEAYDIQMRMDEIASFNTDVSNWSEVTLKKLNVQYRKALKDAGIYDGTKLQKPQNITQGFWEYFKGINEQWFSEACFMDIR